MDEVKPKYLLKIVRPENPAVFVMIISKEGEPLALYDDSILPPEATRFETIEEAREHAIRLANAKREFSTREEQLAWTFVRKNIAYDPWMVPAPLAEVVMGRPPMKAAGFEPKEWNRAIMANCEVVLMEVAPSKAPRSIERFLVKASIPKQTQDNPEGRIVAFPDEEEPQ
jgi:hypothetical protein